MFHNYIRTQNVNYTVQRMTKSTNTDNHLTSRRENRKRCETNKTEKFPSLGVLQQHSVSAKSKSLPPNRCSTHHVLNFLGKNVFLPVVCPDRRYTHHSGRSGLWRCWNENRNFTSQVNTRLKLNMTRKENKFLISLYFYSIRSNERKPDAYEETKISIQYCSIFFITILQWRMRKHRKW